MSSGVSIAAQKLRESLALAARTQDADVTAAVARLTELERDVTLLRRVLQTSNKMLCESAAAAKAQQVTVLTALAGKVVGAESDAADYYEHYKRVHAYMDAEMPAKLAAQFETVVRRGGAAVRWGWRRAWWRSTKLRRCILVRRAP